MLVSTFFLTNCLLSCQAYEMREITTSMALGKKPLPKLFSPNSPEEKYTHILTPYVVTFTSSQTYKRRLNLVMTMELAVKYLLSMQLPCWHMLAVKGLVRYHCIVQVVLLRERLEIMCTKPLKGKSGENIKNSLIFIYSIQYQNISKIKIQNMHLPVRNSACKFAIISSWPFCQLYFLFWVW